MPVRLIPRRSESETEEPGAWGRVWPLVAPHKQRVFTLAVGAFLRGVFEAAFLVTVTRAALAIADGQDQVGVLAGRTTSLEVALLFATLLVVFRLGVALTTNVIATSINADVSANLRIRLANSYLNTSWRTQAAEPSGHLQELLSSFSTTGAATVSAFTASIVAALSLAALLLGALAVDFFATLAVILVLVVLASVLTPLRHRVRLRARTARVAQVDFTTSISELGSLGLEMQTFGVREQFTERVTALVHNLSSSQRRTEVLRGTLVPVYTTLAYAALIGGLASAAIVGVGKLSSLGAVMLIMLRSLAYGQQLQQSSANLMAAIPSLERIDDTIDRYEADPASGGSIAPPAVGTIEFRNVSFSYRDDTPVLTDVSFAIDPGETIGVIGPSGAGKTTLVHLLLGLRDPTEGSLLISGDDLRDVDRSWWSARVAFVAQEPLLFTGDVAENIKFFRDDISMDQVRDAARQANVLDEIEAMPDGFRTDLGPRAGRLSGGQRQRLSIARALVGRPSLLVLDEPTSSLDVNSESLIRQTIADLGGDVTVVIIAHRMSTLDICNRLMVVDAGRLAAFDEPSALRKSSEFFRHALELSGLE